VSYGASTREGKATLFFIAKVTQLMKKISSGYRSSSQTRKKNPTSTRGLSVIVYADEKTHLAKVTMAEFLDKGNARPWDFCCQALMVLFVAGIGVTRCIMVLAGLLHISCRSDEGRKNNDWANQIKTTLVRSDGP
jgi:hypothetical protein